MAFALTLGVVLGILILQNMYDSLPDLLARVQRQPDPYYAYLPGHMPTILPITFLVSLLFSMGSLHRNEDYRYSCLRLQSARISRSLWCAGLPLSFVLFFLTVLVIPRTVEQARTSLRI